MQVQLYEYDTVWKNNVRCLIFNSLNSRIATATVACNSFRCTWMETSHTFLAVWAVNIPLLLLWSWAQEAATTFPIIFLLCIGMLIKYSTNMLHCCPNFRMAYDLLNLAQLRDSRKRGRCFLCPRSKEQKGYLQCSHCHKFVCCSHSSAAETFTCHSSCCYSWNELK